jgi:hypothetical protein
LLLLVIFLRWILCATFVFVHNWQEKIIRAPDPWDVCIPCLIQLHPFALASLFPLHPSILPVLETAS